MQRYKTQYIWFLLVDLVACTFLHASSLLFHFAFAFAAILIIRVLAAIIGSLLFLFPVHCLRLFDESQQQLLHERQRPGVITLVPLLHGNRSAHHLSLPLMCAELV